MTDKKISIRPEEPKQEETPETIELVQWPDKSLFKFIKAHNREGKEIFLIIGQRKTKAGEIKPIQLAGTSHFEIADMICNAVNVVSTAAGATPEKTDENPTT